MVKVDVIEIKHINKVDMCRENKKLKEQLKQAAIQHSRDVETIELFKEELVETTDKLHQLERAVRTQSACWMCTRNKICHQGAALPQSPNVGCGKFNFGYRKSEKHSKTVCDYKHGKMCWAQKGAPECVPEFCPVKEKKEATTTCFSGVMQQ